LTGIQRRGRAAGLHDLVTIVSNRHCACSRPRCDDRPGTPSDGLHNASATETDRGNAWISVWQFAHAHLPRTCRQTVDTPAGWPGPDRALAGVPRHSCLEDARTSV